MTPRTNDGFTLIELIVVIAVLSILAAVALPKFADFTTSAETAAFDGVKGGFTAGIGIVHSKWLADGGSASTVGLDGSTVIVNDTTGWPTVDGANTDQDTASELWALIMSGSVPTGWSSGENTAADAGDATFTQTATSNSFTYEASDGTVN